METNLLQFAGIFSVVSSLMVSTAHAAEVVQIEAIVQKYETRASEDLFDDGRFVFYDAVTFKVVTPMTMAGKTIRVFLVSGAGAGNSRWQTPGQRCRFDFEKDLLKLDHLYQGALENLQWITTTKGAAIDRKLRRADPKLLAGIEKQLVQLLKNGEAETGPVTPRPSSQAAYKLIVDLAKQGERIEQLPEATMRIFDVQPRGGVGAKLVAVFADVRVALIDYTIQDKAGSYVRKTAVMYVQRDGKWLRKGDGAIVSLPLPQP